MNLTHILTYDCIRRCNYCVNQFIPARENGGYVQYQFVNADECYCTMGPGFKHLMLTGGEPMLVPHKLLEHAKVGKQKFERVSLFTQYRDLINAVSIWTPDIVKHVDSIVYSIHTPHDKLALPTVAVNVPVYLSCLVDLYSECLIEKAFRCGFAGLTVRERWPGGRRLTTMLPTFANFSVKYIRQEDCLGTGYVLTPGDRLMSVSRIAEIGGA